MVGRLMFLVDTNIWPELLLDQQRAEIPHALDDGGNGEIVIVGGLRTWDAGICDWF
jgi:hypothetical protein